MYFASRLGYRSHPPRFGRKDFFLPTLGNFYENKFRLAGADYHRPSDALYAQPSAARRVGLALVNAFRPVASPH